MGVRYANRVDDNQRRLVELFRKMGATVLVLSSVGYGCPDLLVSYNGVTILVEIKNGAKRMSQQKLTSYQEKFHETWQGQICIIRTEEDAKKLIYNLRDKNGGEFMLQG